MYKKHTPIFRRKFLPSTYGLLDEAGFFSNNNDDLLVKRLSDKAFLKEINDVANETLVAYQYCDENKERDSGLNITLGGSLDILHPAIGTCSNWKCRRKEAMNIARTAGLFANKLYVSDQLTGYLANVNSPELDAVKMMVTVLKSFAPLINEDIIDLRTPVSRYCTHCIGKINDEIDNFLEANIDIEADMTIYCLDSFNKINVILIDNPDLARLSGTSLAIQIPKGKKSGLPKLSVNDQLIVKLKNNPYILGELKDSLTNNLMNVVSSVDSAHKTSSLFISKSELDTLFLSSIDRNIPQKNELDTWEALRSVNLPWVGELDIPQILMLRHQASASLEALRENLSVGFMQGGEKKATEVVSELTSKVTELKQEIMANDIVKKSNKRYSAGFGSIAITLVFYGLASNVPAAAVGSVAALLAALSHMRTSEKEQEEKNGKVLTSPAYALLKAKDLLSCKE